jgi:glucose-6-phosphate isomerase
MTNSSKAWKELEAASKTKLELKKEFSSNANRAKELSLNTPKVTYDFSRQLINKEILSKLIALANEAGLKEKIAAMFKGEKINKTEGRAVLHIALRNLNNSPILVDNKDVMPEVNAVLAKIEKFTKTNKLKHIMAVGIGGSQLGPEYLAEALKAYAKPGMKLVFVANVDGTDFARKSAECDPEQTLVIVISKTFTTAETMMNAQSAKKWLTSKLGNSPEIIKKHFVAVSTAKDKVEAFGIDPENMFGFWDWVGGRFSSTSAVGALPLSLLLGYDNFKKILEGANWLDEHFLNEPFENNIPVLSALLDIWNVNFMGLTTRAILPYSQAWSRYAAHCQQVEMESNGKRVDIEGKPLNFHTGEVVFGEPGTNGQHSFYQLIHQGMIVPCDFIGFKKAQYDLKETEAITHHDELMTNFFAQPDALAFGKEDTNQHKFFPGNRPSNVFLLNEQGPFEAGVLLALVEHRTAVKGFIWGLNSFDQFGVELGKVLGKDMRNRISAYKANKNDPKVYEELNRSTKELFKQYLNK